MSQIQTVTRRWGNSLGIAIPKEIVEMEHLGENQRVLIEIKKVIDVRKLKGLLTFKKSSQELKDEMREGWHD